MNLMQRFWLCGGIISCSWIFPNLVKSQVVPDKTTSTNVVGDCLAKCDITGGIQAESNLFHSFQEFNIGKGESLYFDDPGVANIFTRVTGNNSTEIFGTLGVTGNANLWLLNPQGILFGNGATLDLNGSLIVTTADEIIFGDRGIFTANPDTGENLPLLTVNPSAFFYQQMGQNNPIIIQETLLTLPDEESLVLLGAQNTESNPGILMQNAEIEVNQGNVQIGAVAAEGTIEIDSDFKLQFPNNITKGDITLDRDSHIHSTGVKNGEIAIDAAILNITRNSHIESVNLGNLDSGDIRITARQLNLTQGRIASANFGTGASADIIIDTESLNLSGRGVAEFQVGISRALTGDLTPSSDFSGIIANASDRGAAGDIIIKSNSILADNGAIIATITYNRGAGGDLDIRATENIQLTSSALLSFSAAESLGDAGDLTIKTGNLNLQESSIISAATLGQGSGGDIKIQVGELIELAQTLNDSILPTIIFTNSVSLKSDSSNLGDAGDIKIETNNLIVKDGARISSASGILTNEGLIPFGGAGGDIDIQADESITVSGSSFDGRFATSIISDTRNISPAGNITINTGKLLLEKEALISASSFNAGEGGNLSINATESINLNGAGIENLFRLYQNALSGGELGITNIQGGLFSFTITKNGGDINLISPILSLSNGAVISTTTFGPGHGGNIQIKASETTDINSSLITSATLNLGESGNLEIDTSNLIVRNGGVLTTSTNSLGQPGDMKIDAREKVELYNDKGFILPIQGSIVTSNRGGLGRAGNLFLSTKNLAIQDGLEINIANEIPSLPPTNDVPLQATTDPGYSVIKATESITISGISADGLHTSGINSTTQTAVPANNIQIVTPQLTVSEGGKISVNSLGTGAAANLEIIADRVFLETGGQLSADTVSGQGGNINLKIADTLQLSDRSALTTNAFNQGDGGNINVETQFLLAFLGSNITANAIAGRGGKIDIIAEDLFVVNPNQISANSVLGIDGEVRVSTFTTELRNNLTKLPEQTLQKDRQIISSCSTGEQYRQSSFVYIGKGALPPSPLDSSFARDELMVDWGAGATEFSLHSPAQSTKYQPVEATAWIVSDRGKVILTRAEPTSTSLKSPQTLLSQDPTNCPF
jgi:filamentous hemagglutinin family protein